MGKNLTDEEEKDKRIAYYSVMISAFVNSRITKDKLLITLSSGGIALLLSFMSFIKDKGSIYSFSFFTLASICFLATICITLYILQKNTDLIIADITKETQRSIEINKKLKINDKISFISFILGIIFSFSFVISIFIKQNS